MNFKKVLVVEDDESIRSFMKEVLESEGYSVECAANGEEGIQALRHSEPPPRLILLDIAMPIKDGYQFREEQNLDDSLAKVPVVVMTADYDIAKKTAKIGAKDFIKKPFDLDHLLELVEQYCE